MGLSPIKCYVPALLSDLRCRNNLLSSTALSSLFLARLSLSLSLDRVCMAWAWGWRAVMSMHFSRWTFSPYLGQQQLYYHQAPLAQWQPRCATRAADLLKLRFPSFCQRLPDWNTPSTRTAACACCLCTAIFGQQSTKIHLNPQ